MIGSAIAFAQLSRLHPLSLARRYTPVPPNILKEAEEEAKKAAAEAEEETPEPTVKKSAKAEPAPAKSSLAQLAAEWDDE